MLAQRKMNACRWKTGTPTRELLHGWRHRIPLAQDETAKISTKNAHRLGGDFLLFRDRSDKAALNGDKCLARNPSVVYRGVKERGVAPA
jgi:hypothetical protein